MFASFRLLNGQSSKVTILYNQDLKINYTSQGRNALRYHKVSKSKKQELINLVLNDGKSIIEAAKILQINYSTAKSIILNRKKRMLSSEESSISIQKQGNSTISNHLTSLIN